MSIQFKGITVFNQVSNDQAGAMARLGQALNGKPFPMVIPNPKADTLYALYGHDAATFSKEALGVEADNPVIFSATPEELQADPTLIQAAENFVNKIIPKLEAMGEGIFGAVAKYVADRKTMHNGLDAEGQPIVEETIPVNTAPAKPSKIHNVTDADFDREVIQASYNQPVLVDFHGEAWCAPCQALAPVLDEMAEHPALQHVKFVKVDIDDNQQAARQYKVYGVPALRLFKDGQVVDEVKGFDVQELERLLNSVAEKPADNTQA